MLYFVQTLYKSILNHSGRDLLFSQSVFERKVYFREAFVRKLNGLLLFVCLPALYREEYSIASKWYNE